jgi:phospholipid/cholesterol/gamma-HCH transport system substrate-binding protein
MKRAIKTHAGDFGAIIALLILSIVVAGYVLHNERLRFPFIESSPFKVNAEFSTAQAVTPGQGQSVRVSGVQIGDIGQVTLRNGMAVVQMNITDKYKGLIHQDASALLRPRTGLKDMFVELNPGTGNAPKVNEGYTIPVSNTAPDINLDEIFSALDADTRQYLDLLVNGAGQGLKTNGGNQLAEVLRRFEPTHQDLARLNTAVAARGENLRRLVNSLQRLNTSLASRQNQIVQLVDSSALVFRALASQDQNISRAVADLPGTLRQTTATLGKVQSFAQTLGPAATNLIPAVNGLPAANAALASLAKPSAPIIQNQIRPFVVAARPVVRKLKPASVNLAKGTPNLGKTFDVLNHLVNLLGYYPGGAQHGYLWWLAWLGHDVRTLFSVQDAGGVFRPLFLQASCATLAQIANGLPGGAGELLLNLTPILTNLSLCPKQHAADARAYQQFQKQQQQAKSSSGGRTTRGAASDKSSTANGSGGIFYPKLPTN